MAKKTPDYTRQAKRSSGGQARRQARVSAPAASRQQKYGGRSRNKAEASGESPIQKGVLTSSLIVLMGGAGFFLWVTVSSAMNMGATGAQARQQAIATFGGLCGMIANLCVLVLLLHTYDPRRHPFPRIRMTWTIYGFVVCGIAAFMIALFGNGILVFGPGLLPAVGVFYFILKPRLKAVAVDEGRYTPRRREQARRQYEEEEAARRAEKENYERLKAARLGTGKYAKNKASDGGKPASGGRGAARAKGRPQA